MPTHRAVCLNNLRLFLFVFLCLGVVHRTMATEEARYEVVRKDGSFELRDYSPQLLAEILMSGSIEDAGDRAFRPLFDFISGGNESMSDIAMTAPVELKAAGEEIAMTAPVGQENRGSNQWAISFMMPDNYTIDTLPRPTNPDVKIREVPARRIAAVRYSGRWTGEKYYANLEKLKLWIAEQKLIITGEPVWARYNAPFVPWFLRRNEVLIPVTAN